MLDIIRGILLVALMLAQGFAFVSAICLFFQKVEMPESQIKTEAIIILLLFVIAAGVMIEAGK